MVTLKQYYYLAENHFTPEFCDKVIHHAEQDQYTPEDRQYEFRDSNVVFLPQSKDTEWLYDPLYKVLNEAKQKCWRTFKVEQLQNVQYTVYKAPAGRYNWHCDTGQPTSGMERRILSIVVQLLDPNTHSGGEFEIAECATSDLNKVVYGQIPDPKFVKSLKPPRGSVIVFPSFVQHRVSPVTVGTRKSLVGWCDGRFI